MKRLLLAASLLLALTGCQKIKDKLAHKAEESAVEAASGGDVKVSSGGVTVTTDKGTVAMDNKLPADWPADLPAYPGATIKAAMSTPQGKSLVMETTDGPDKVHDFYKGKMSSMKLLADTKTPTMQNLAYQSGKRNVSITASGSSPTTITVSASGG